MDPERVRSYLQVACAGLGFDIGEVWWTSNEKGSSTTIAAIEDQQDRHQNGGASVGLVISNGNDKEQNKKKLHFVQLYTSKSYEDRRGMLINPPQRDSGELPKTLRRSGSSGELEKHVLSPRLVDSIAETSQIVWANTKKTEGLLGRSDMRLQTAVGMPVAVDNDGNMCVVVMFSPNNVQFSDDAMEYLQFISECATSSTIPCLLPAFQSMDGRQLMHVPEHHHMIPHVENLGDGVVAQYLSFEDFSVKNSPLSAGTIMHNSHDLTSAPKDCFGIPMLPSSAELGHATIEENPETSAAPISDVFDEASYGVWSTIMSNALDELPLSDPSADFVENETTSEGSLDSEVMLLDSPIMPQFRKERLEEFTSAFLGMSVFDVADVWIPNRLTDADSLCHVTSVVANENNSALVEFKKVSEHSRIKCWSGAVGRAFSSGNPVWSANQKVIVDSARAAAFGYAKIQTAFAIPVFSARTASPACVVCCYSLVRSDSVPCVLRFVQQALRLLWDGLDKVEPHESVGVELWRDVAPADLGEMAADIEMQQHFLKKKRPLESISAISQEREYSQQDSGASLAAQFQGLEPSDRPRVAFSPLFVSVFAAPAPALTSHLSVYGENSSSVQTGTLFQSQMAESVPTVAVPSSYHQHRATNSDGSKRAHVFTPEVIEEIPEASSSTQSTPSVAQNYINPTFQEGHAVPDAPSNVPSQIPQPSNFGSSPTSGMHAQSLNASNGPVLLQPVASFMVQTSPFSPVVPSLPVGFLFGQPPVRETVSIQQVDETASNGYDNASSGQLYSSSGQYSEYSEYDPSKAVCAPCTSADVDFNESSSLDSGNSGNKRCRIQGCADPAVARRPYCVKHSGNRLCEHTGCKKCAQGSTRFCIAHGGGRRCTFPGCDKGARDKFFCAAHGGGKRCKFETCSKSAVGGSNFCTAHGGGRRCAVAGCDKSAQSSTSFCVKHGGGKKCANPECEKVARGRTNFCAAHGGGVRCKLEGCNRVAIGKLQLCRTHGGGARKKSSSTGSPNMSPSISLSSFGSEQQSPIAIGVNGLAIV